MKSNAVRRKVGSVEQLEPRCLLSTISPFQSLPGSSVHPLIAAGSPTGTPADTPAQRVDPNLTTSPFAGVGSLTMVNKKGSGSCTATPIADRFILTAAHCVDLNDDGRVTKKDGLISVTFNLNYGSDLSHQILVQDIHTHPDYTGFNRPSVNDDLAVLTLSSPLPAGVPIYPRYIGAMTHTLIIVGYGWSGDGVSGFTIPAGVTVKRIGENSPDSLSGQDELFRPAANEVFTYDFDGPTGNGPLGGPTLGNALEAAAGPGDSGGPSFVLIGSDTSAATSYAIAGVNTFTLDNGSIHTPFFGSMAGGIIVASYETWILAVLNGQKFSSPIVGSGGSGGFSGRGGYSRPPGVFHTPSINFQSNPIEQPIVSDRSNQRDTDLKSAQGSASEATIPVAHPAAAADEVSATPDWLLPIQNEPDSGHPHDRAIDHLMTLDEIRDALIGF